MQRYEFRYFFDPGSGTCLWSANAMAREKFGYAVELDFLDLPSDVVSRASEVLNIFDSSIDWHDPTANSPWPQTQRDQFIVAADELLDSLREALGPDFEVRLPK